MRSSLVNKKTTKDAWDAIAVACIYSYRAYRYTLQKLRLEWENLAFKLGEDVNDFALHLNTLMQQLAWYSDNGIDEERVVEKFLHVPPLESVTIGGKLLFTEEQWLARQWERRKRETSGSLDLSSSSSRKLQPHKPDKVCGGALDSVDGERKATHDDTCKNYGRTSHWAKDSRQAKRGGQAHVMQAQEGDKPALFLVHGSIELHSSPTLSAVALLDLDEL
ncbi:unnamed protein product [Miscanthus lutarioriparius]|uniref:Uncharacterized protein n=1 Tax=Miscanthus lutarioriparius TaxID=422564 RepID=A0A811RQ63_9POAL|nr:unnamed protein product [Miscanthus lutarioriparius]